MTDMLVDPGLPVGTADAPRRPGTPRDADADLLGPDVPPGLVRPGAGARALPRRAALLVAGVVLADAEGRDPAVRGPPPSAAPTTTPRGRRSGGRADRPAPPPAARKPGTAGTRSRRRSCRGRAGSPPGRCCRRGCPAAAASGRTEGPPGRRARPPGNPPAPKPATSGRTTASDTRPPPRGTAKWTCPPVGRHGSILPAGLNVFNKFSVHRGRASAPIPHPLVRGLIGSRRGVGQGEARRVANGACSPGVLHRARCTWLRRLLSGHVHAGNEVGQRARGGRR